MNRSSVPRLESLEQRLLFVQTVQLTLSVDPATHTWRAYEQNSDPSTTAGLAGLQFDVVGDGGATVTSSQNDLPQGFVASIGTTGFTVLRSDGANGQEIRAYQANTYKQDPASSTSNLYLGIGNAPQNVDTGSGTISVGLPALIGEGSYSGDSGTLTISSDPALVTLLPAVLPTPSRAGADYATFSPDAVTGQSAPVIPVISHTQVVGRHLFYNNSVWDGNSTAANAADDAAIATDKVALLPGGTASFANYTSYSKGINGILIDVTGLDASATLSPADFGILVGNGNDTGSWTNGPAPTVTLRRGAGQNGGDRIELTWADFTSKIGPNQTPDNSNAIGGKWVQITLKANANTGLSTADTFYFGNAPGDSGDNAANTFVNATDEIGARTDPHNFTNPAAVTNVHDYNRDKKVDATDQIIARFNGSNFVNALKLITPSGSGAPASATALAALNAAASATPQLLEQRGKDPKDSRAWYPG